MVKNSNDFIPVPEGQEEIPIETNVDVVRATIENITGKSADIVLHDFKAGNVRALSLMCDGMSDQLLLSETIMKPLTKMEFQDTDDFIEKIKSDVVTETDIKDIDTINKAIEEAMAGFFIVFFEGEKKCVSFSVQGFEKRGLEEPVSESQERGARVGFNENFKTNITLIRRRIRSSELKFELMSVGSTGKNQLCLCYLRDRIEDTLLEDVKNRIKSADFDMVLSTGYLQPFLDTKHLAIFSGVGVTERPDTLCAKLGEGKIGVILDGTPYAVYVPHVFVENLHSFDDYGHRPIYATFIRLLKFAAFIISVILPGLYVSLTIFHHELFPEDMLFSVLSAELKTPFPITVEAILIHLIFEIMREAGLRMPKTVGHAVSIVGALVIGDAAVTGGLIAAPMLIVVALTAISSFVMPEIYNPVAILRLVFIVIGGTLGLYGIVLAFIVLIVNMTAINPYHIPYTSPVAPLVLPAFRDVIYRQSWKKMSRKLQVNKTLETRSAE